MYTFFNYFFVIAIVVVGCSPMPKVNSLPGKTGKGIISTLLSSELRDFGSKVSFDETSLATVEVGWHVEGDTNSVTIWIEGDHTTQILNEFKRQCGEPAFFKTQDSRGYMAFAYRKDQCGVILNCGIDPGSDWGLKSPMTHIVISHKLPSF